MSDIRGITICRTAPNDRETMPGGMSYDDVLRITLPANMRHLTECVVVTSPEDERTRAVVADVSGARTHLTDAFTRHGASFNKGLAMEEGLDALGRHGWILIFDADILFPSAMRLAGLRMGHVHGARRRMLDDPSQWRPDLEWATLPVGRDGSPIGYFQLFHAGSSCLRDKRPWYDVSFAHAGGGDAYFLKLFGPRRKMLGLDVLHLGPRDVNWFGTEPESRAVMNTFVSRNGWKRAIRPKDPASIGPITERVNVPGYEPSGFELPFVRRANDRRERMARRGRPS